MFLRLDEFQVQLGTCGDPVSYYVVECDTSDNFNSAALFSVVLDGDDLLLTEQVQQSRHVTKHCISLKIATLQHSCLV